MKKSMNAPIILDCDKCGTHAVFGPDGLKGDDRIVCPACNVDYGSVADLVQKEVAKLLQTGLGKAVEGVKGVKFTKNDL